MKKVQYIDPIIGSVGEAETETSHGGGKTHPGACVPGGMVQLAPDTITGGDNGTGYNYCQDTIEGFSFNHMSGIGWYGDLGNLQIMPVVGETDLRSGSNEFAPLVKGKEGWKSPFSHERETAQGGYYSVVLDRYNILAEATVTCRTGMLRVTYPENSDGRLIFNFSRRIGGKADFEEINVIDNKIIEGHIKCTPAGGGFGHGHGGIYYDYYFSCHLSQKASQIKFFSNEEYVDGEVSSFSHEDAGLVACFGGEVNEPIVLRCGVSYVSLDGARKNLSAECDSFDFDATRERAAEQWEDVFKNINVEGSDETDLKIFYTCLYHVLLDPRCCADVDGSFTFGGDTVFKEEYTHRTVFSGWDVYRSEFPLLGVIRPDILSDAVKSLLKIATHKNTSLPRWELLGINAGCMVGDPGAIVVSDAVLKGIDDFDTEKAYEIIKASTYCEKELYGKPFESIRPHCKQYLEDCYVPEELSDTLEYLLADYTTARLAQKLGKQEDADAFINRVKTYKDNFNKDLGFMAPRYEDGSFVYEENEYDDDGCVESNIFQQSWFVPYDVSGLADLFGKERVFELLERFFEKAELGALWNDDYNHSNEPCHNITHYFSILGKPHRTQYWTRRVQKEAYRTGAFGFCGNEDVGQLSAWYVLSALGFAQVCPGEQVYYINTPLFKKAEIKLDSRYHKCKVSDTFCVECDKDPLQYPYIKSARFNGEELKGLCLTFDEITSGGVLSFELSKTPCESYGIDVPKTFLY